MIDELGGPKHFNHFPSAWAHAMDTPFQWTKQVASHFGGTRNPLIVSWPARIEDKGGLRTQFLHTIDIVPTLYELTGITPPVELNGVQQKPIEGISFAYTFDDAAGREPAHHAILRAGKQSRASITTAGWRRPSRSRPGNRTGRDSTPTSRSGSSTTSTRTSRRPTTSRARIRRSFESCRTSGGRRRPGTTSCRWTGAPSNG